MLQFGVHLPVNAHAENPGPGIGAVARAAEELGFASVWANDVIVTSASRDWSRQPIEPLITLASLIHQVPKLKLGVSVLVLPQRNAFIVAKQAAALDLLSGGRFILGVGIGWREDEFALLNADHGHRGAITDEAIEVLRTLWRDPVASFHGQFYDFSEAQLFPKPASGGPPVWIGGNSKSALRRAAHVGQAWLPFGIKIEDFRAGVEALRKSARNEPWPTAGLEVSVRVEQGHNPSSAKVFVDPNAWPQLVGTPDTIGKVLQEYREAGLEHVICGFDIDNPEATLQQMQLWAKEVMPQFDD